MRASRNAQGIATCCVVCQLKGIQGRNLQLNLQEVRHAMLLRSRY